MARYTVKQENNENSKKSIRRLITVLSLAVVFVTSYLLIMPALTLEADPICGKEEHTHTRSCYEMAKTLICEQEECEGHVHTDSCYETETVLTCTNESEEHVHDESCYQEETALVCSIPETSGHHHDDSCYKETPHLTCILEEHTHDDTCYAEHEKQDKGEKADKADQQKETTASSSEGSEEDKDKEKDKDKDKEEEHGDPNADVESPADWESTMAGVYLTGDWAHDLLAVAESQVGYTESSANFIVEEDRHKGYSRYGAWYGDPYGDWCAMFVSFCLHYAGIGPDVFPREAECGNYIAAINSYGLYHSSASDYQPKPGDIIFFNYGSERAANHVGIVYAVQGDTIVTIEGNFGDSVGSGTYNRYDGLIVGFGELPKNPALASQEEASEFRYEDDRIEVLAVLADGSKLPSDTVFSVSQLPADSPAYQEAEARVAAYAEENALTVIDHIPYDMHFEKDGEEIEPGCSVQVTVNYKQAMDIGNTNADSKEEENSKPTEENILVLHMKEESDTTVVEEVTQNVELNAQDQIETAEFEVESFSVIDIVYVDSTETKGWVKPGSYTDFSTVLGDSIYYGITAGTLNKTGHIDSTFAVQQLNSSQSDATTGAYTNKAGAIWIASMTGGPLEIHGKPTEVYCPDEVAASLKLSDGCYQTPVLAEDAYDYVAGLLNHAALQSASLAGEETTAGKQQYFQNSKKIDLTQEPAGTYYLDGDFFFRQKWDMDLKINGDQTVVFNFNSTDPSLYQYKITVDGVSYDTASSNETMYTPATHVIYNMPNAATLNIQSAISGIVLAPYATLTNLGGTSSGWLIVNNVAMTNSEWHFVSQGLPEKIPTSTGFRAYKMIGTRIPTKEEKFTFRLTELLDGRWETVEEVENKGTDITFGTITYSTAEQTGTHWYMISEDLTPVSGYEKTEDRYLIKVEVSAVPYGSTIRYTKTKTIYYADPDVQILQGGKVDESVLEVIDSESDVVFINEKDERHKSIMTTIEVDKKWLAKDGTDITDTIDHEAISFDLIQTRSDNRTIKYGTYTIGKEDNWYIKISKLPLIDEDDYSYTYRVAEHVEDERYVVSYDNNEGAGNGVILMINTEKGDHKTRVRVDKKWFRSDGKEITDEKQGQIYFDLYKVVKEKEQESTGDTDAAAKLVYTPEDLPETAEKIESKEALNGSSSWTWAKEYEVPYGEEWEFFAVETTKDPNIQKTAYERTTDESGEIIVTIRNTLVPETYELPHTGGRGSGLYRMIGILLAGMAAGLLLIAKRKRG